jgi:quercetin dioxygenase-like cupin family protein
MRRAVVAILIAFAPCVAHAEKQTVEIDNQWVRATRIVLEPHEGLGTGDFPECVVVNVTPAAETKYFPAGKCVIDNSSNQPLESILIELKPGAGRPPSPPITLDPVKIDPKYHTVDFENDRVRVLRTVLEPHIKSPPHQHPAYVVVYVTELHTTMAISDGRLVDNVRRKGEVAWRDAMQHSTENIGRKTAMEIQVELK